jgi:hypothetical protein
VRCRVCGREAGYLKYSFSITHRDHRVRYFLCSLPCALELIVDLARGQFPLTRREEVKVL